MKTKNMVLATLALLMLSSPILLATVKAAWPSLPATEVQLSVVDGTTSYFISTLSGVPAGFDVHNGVYVGWCVDRSVTMVRSVSHDVILYSSISPPVLTGINWIAVNYILNHKQGTMMDVQEAIWYFTDAFTPTTATGQAMVTAANANPSYDPTTGSVLAVICLPQDHPDAQNSIIELTIPQLEPGFTPGFWKHNIEVRLSHAPYNKGLTKASYNAFEGGPLDGVKLTDQLMDDYLAEIDHGLTFEQALANLSLKGWDPLRTDTANAFNAAAGYGPFED